MSGRKNPHPAAGLGGHYIRLSALPVDYDPFSPDTQRRICQEAADRQGAKLVREFVDLDYSARKDIYRIGVLAERARAEADQIAWRVEQFQETARRMGLWVRVRPYGYDVEDRRLKPRPEEALIVRRIVNEFLDGASLRSIAKQLNDDGIPCPKAVIHAEAKAKGHRVKPVQTSSWSYMAVRSILTTPVTAALHSHNRQLIYDEKGEPISCGEGIVTLGERARILAELERRSTTVHKAQAADRVGKRTGGGRPAKYLLTGFARCAHCHSAMSRTVVFAGKRKYDAYRCSRKVQGQPCRGGSIMAEPFESEVVWRYTARLAACEPDDPLIDIMAERWLSQTLPESEADRRRLSDAVEIVKRRIKDLYDDRYERHLFETAEDLAEWEERVTKARYQRDALQAQLDALGPRKKLDIGGLLETELSSEAWKRTPLERQRELLRLGVKVVLVYNARRGKRPVSERIRIVFADEEVPEPAPDDDPQDARLMIANLVAEERAGRRPPLTGSEAAALIGFIKERQAQKLLADERAKQAGNS